MNTAKKAALPGKSRREVSKSSNSPSSLESVEREVMEAMQKHAAALESAGSPEIRAAARRVRLWLKQQPRRVRRVRIWMDSPALKLASKAAAALGCKVDDVANGLICDTLPQFLEDMNHERERSGPFVLEVTQEIQAARCRRTGHSA